MYMETFFTYLIAGLGLGVTFPPLWIIWHRLLNR